MIVTLCAGHIGTQENGKRVGQVVEGHTGVTQEVTRGSRRGQAPLSGQHVGDHLVPGAVEGNLVLEPSFIVAVVETLDALLVA